MVLIFSALLGLGLLAGQVVDLSGFATVIGWATSMCLAYIMVEVGLEFSVEKRAITSYGRDALYATIAALLPALLWFLYFTVIIGSGWQAGLLSGLSSAPTSAGVLFAMLSAAGLGATWVFKKARVLAVLDDLVTVLLLAPLQIIVHGFEWRAIAAFAIIGVCLCAAFRWQNTVRLPTSRGWLLVYAAALAAIVFTINTIFNIHVDVLIPAFAWGCLMQATAHQQDKSLIINPDTAVKGAFMLLVGLSLPKIMAGSLPMAATAAHVLMLVLLANIGKLFLVFCYSNEAPFKQRLALGIAMFPRGEVGAAVLLIGTVYGLSGYANTLAVMGLAFNLVLTGAFIWAVMRCLK